MNKLLIKSLSEISNDVIKSTSSIYFVIGSIKVRLSDHMSDSTDAHLAVIPSIRGYIVFPLKLVAKKQIMVLPNINSVLLYIKQYNYFFNIFVTEQSKTIDKANRVTSNIDFNLYPETQSWLCVKSYPDNVQLLTTILSNLKKSDIQPFLNKLKTFDRLDAKRKNIWLQQYVESLNL